MDNRESEEQISEAAVCESLLEDTLQTMRSVIHQTSRKSAITNCGFTIDNNFRVATPVVCGAGYSVADLPKAKKEKGSYHTHHKPEHYLGNPRPTAADIMDALVRGHDFICVSETTRPEKAFCYYPAETENWAARKLLERWRMDQVQEKITSLAKKYGSLDEARKHWSEATNLELIRLHNEIKSAKNILADTIRDNPEKLFKSCSIKLGKGTAREDDWEGSRLAEDEAEGSPVEEVSQVERLWKQIWGEDRS